MSRFNIHSRADYKSPSIKSGGAYVIGEKNCSAGDRQSLSPFWNPCPPVLWNNINWRSRFVRNQAEAQSKVAQLLKEGPDPGLADVDNTVHIWQWWNERRIRKFLALWAAPAFGKSTLLEAEASAAGVDRKFIEQKLPLKAAADVFYAMFPEKPRWRLASGFYGLSSLYGVGWWYPENLRRRDKENSMFSDSSGYEFHYWHPKDRDWRTVPEQGVSLLDGDPGYLDRYQQSKKFLGLTNKSLEDAWYAAANKLINEVPGSEDNVNVRTWYGNLIAFRPGAVIVNPWVTKFVDLFGRNQSKAMLSRAPARLPATRPQIPGAVKR